MLKICAECSTEFEGKTNARYCTTECRTQGGKHTKSQYLATSTESRKEYAREYGKAFRKRKSEADPDYFRKKSIKELYGLSWEEYQGLLLSGCAGCGGDDRLVIDHDHSCCPGRYTCGHCVRGVLCWGCNVILGRIEDSTNILRNLIDYLEQERPPHDKEAS